MAGDLISKKTRGEFREYLVGWTLRDIEMEFDAADVPCATDFTPSCSGQRRSLVEQYYHAVNFADWKDVRKILRVFEGVLVKIDELIKAPPYLTTPATLVQTQALLAKWLKRDGFHYENGRILFKGQVASLPTIQEAAADLDVPELHRQLDRLRTAVDDDPSLAIGTAKELVETTCKTILHSRGEAIADAADIGELLKATRKVLGLLPDDVPAAAKGAEVIKRLLSNLGAVGQGLGELRNLYGTGHGRMGAAKGLSARHARLAVGSAATLATFLLETHEEKPVPKSLDTQSARPSSS